MSSIASAFDFTALSADEVSTLKSGEVFITVRKGEELDHNPTVTRGGIEIMAPSDIVLDLIKDCGKINEFSTDIRDCMILEESPTGEYDIRKEKFAVSPFLPKFKSTFRTDYTTDESNNHIVKVTRISGDLKVQDARWDILTLEPNKSRLIYQAAIKPSLPIPNRVIREQTAIGIPVILKNIRTVSEAHHEMNMKMKDLIKMDDLMPSDNE
ncbi:hypothetical protein N9W89_00160 [Hellea sp.]|nr:hypothetical protein [Hellea sp.]